MFDVVHESFWSEEGHAPQIRASMRKWRHYVEFHDLNWEVLVATICARGYWGADEMDAAVTGIFKSCASSRS